MIQKVSERISVRIKDRTFDLVWNPEGSSLSACSRCALMGEVCKCSRDMSLSALCAAIVEEPETFFIPSERKAYIGGVYRTEIVLSALSQLRDECLKDGNRARAKVAQILIEEIGG